MARAKRLQQLTEQMKAQGIHPQAVDEVAAAFEARSMDRLRTAVERHGEDGVRAYKALHKATKPPTVIGNLVSLFWDDEKGFKLAGIVGGALGAYAGYGMMEKAGGGWFGLLAFGMMTLLSAWAGNKAKDAITGVINRNKTPPAPEPGLSRSPERGQAESRAADIPPQLREQARETGIAGTEGYEQNPYATQAGPTYVAGAPRPTEKERQ